MNKVLTIQTRYKLKRMIITQFNNEIEFIYEHMYGVMKRIHENFKNDIIAQYKYNIYINKLDLIISKFKILPRPFRLKHYLETTTLQTRDILNKIYSELISLTKECGAYTIFDIIKLEFKESSIDFITNYKTNSYKLIKFYNKVFILFSITRYLR